MSNLHMHHETSRRFCNNFHSELKTFDMVNNSIVTQYLNAGSTRQFFSRMKLILGKHHLLPMPK